MAGDTTTIARPYAEAVFAIAHEQDALQRWSDALTMLSAVLSDPQISVHIGDPNVPRQRLCDLIVTSAAARVDLAPELVNLVQLLGEYDRLMLLPDIARLFEQQKNAEQGLRHVVVRTPYPLSAEDQETLATALRTRFGAQVTLSIEEDPTLIGGLEIRTDDVVIDGSIRGRLQQLATELQF
ncbi:F0F1 ATP synthase subunit delta [Rhodoferax sp. 4810]|uniref:ATP synthase subunit delta n=1 Tax=Thiospirillum jenense TaxID=1653858 RepID=A0A839HD18_9GAMM|nr:F0F1 ATP synthase subunit delta [Thiospirillum jenense]MBB1072981.1 F0F1 ATP synthase subunit delta [Rhodoferax jenense]MBB1124929.1 F0F1 ATP synthase subunit delta [Thiospirillum jenense]